MKNACVSFNNRLALGLAVALFLSAAQVQAFSLPIMPWDTPESKMADGCDNVKSGVGKIFSGITGALYSVLASGASATGLSYAWKNYREATALTLTTAAVLAYWAVYRMGKAQGKKEMARAIVRSVRDEQPTTDGIV